MINTTHPTHTGLKAIGLLTILLVLFLHTACETNIDIDKEYSSPLLVVNSFISPDTTVSAQVSLSRFFLSDTATFNPVNNAQVSVIVNNQWKEQMILTSNGGYQGRYHPQPGDNVRIAVKTPVMEEVYAESQIPKTPGLIDVDTSMTIEKIHYIVSATDTLAKETFYKIKFSLTFTDNVNESNYYRVIVHNRNYYYIPVWNTIIESSNDNYTFTYNDVLSDNINDVSTNLNDTKSNKNNKYAIFSDALINGKKKTLTFYADYYIYKRYPNNSNYNQDIEKTDISVSLQNISKDYYFYLQSRNENLNNGNSLFSEPVQIKSNFKGGIGILGSYASSNKAIFYLK